eukprot:10483546-Heterocapsa_arctica.AAC.1
MPLLGRQLKGLPYRGPEGWIPPTLLRLAAAAGTTESGSTWASGCARLPRPAPGWARLPAPGPVARPEAREL